MPKRCPKCNALPDTLNEEQSGMIQFSVSASGKVSEKGEIQDQDPSGIVVGVCSQCGNEWVIKGISQAHQYSV